MQTMMRQLCPCSPWGSMGMQRSTCSQRTPGPMGVHGDAEIHPQPEDSTLEQLRREMIECYWWALGIQPGSACHKTMKET
ncbi:hypothetical protein HGM15179_002114 [Zosterops borbonicus]|uniref:Uncharacterized protein n=1 Tax=Zosterops borbonicus TaxID=364589 RepID=A0A8K1LSU0_9PASS|nr:hypothetical protein HGM15179_002114 [Zosterops borbonicus]